MKVSSDVYAEFVLSRIPKEVAKTLTSEQYTAFRNALIAQDEAARHSLDIRIRIPFYFAAYYFVLFGGRDRRKTVRMLELSRIQKFPLWLRVSVYTTVTSVIIFALFSMLFTGLYLLKSYAGIDLTPWHLYDVIPLELFNFGKGHG